MRILAICQYGWPEPYPFLYPMEEMVKRGHEVFAVTGMPNYPMGEFYEGYKRNRTKKETHNGVSITRVPVIPRKQDTLHRFLNYHSYPIFAKREIKKADGSCDVVFVNQSSPVMMAEPAIAYAEKWKKKLVLYCMDLWPASLTLGGIRKDSAVYRYYRKVSARVYHKADTILITSRMFKDYLASEFGIPEEKIIYLPQSSPFEAEIMPESQKKEAVDLVFAGNVGTAQNLEVLLDAVEILKSENTEGRTKPVFFHIIGDGSMLEKLKRQAKDRSLDSIIFHGRKPPEAMPEYYAMADAMIVTMLPDPVISLTLPAKVQGYMAAGKPVIACADGETASVIKDADCGFCAEGGNAEAFAGAIKAFLKSGRSKELGENAKKYYDDNFSTGLLMDRLEKILLSNVGKDARYAERQGV